MIYLTVTNGLLALLVTGLVVALLLERKATAELLAHFEAMHQSERARFLAAVQRPDLVQPPQAARHRSPEDMKRQQERAHNLAAVGTVQHAKGDL